MSCDVEKFFLHDTDIIMQLYGKIKYTKAIDNHILQLCFCVLFCNKMMKLLYEES